MAMSFYSSFGLPISIARPFNTYGPRQSARAVIPSIIIQLAKNNGSQPIRLGALDPTRDFNFVSDTVAGFLALMTAENVSGQVFNFGSNFEISIGETAELIAEVMEIPLRIESDAVRLRPQNSEVERLWADNRKARERLNWTPQYAGRDGLRRGLQETVAWFSNPENARGYRADIYNI